MAADTRVLIADIDVSGNQTNFRAGKDQKLFKFNNIYVAMTYGNGPISNRAEDNVPAIMKTIIAGDTVKEMCNILLERFSSFNPLPRMSILLAGPENGAVSVYEIEIIKGQQGIRKISENIIARGNTNDLKKLKIEGDWVDKEVENLKSDVARAIANHGLIENSVSDTVDEVEVVLVSENGLRELQEISWSNS
ncbi:MAG TPA: hypothetical protein PKL53_06285 [Methylotenera sp.]|nr:hypothetical protein [Methylotenera sp.]HPV45728.1 hypothetical protein [Methylotenera sp.]